ALDRPMPEEARVLLGPLTADLMMQGAPAADVCRFAERALAGGELMRMDVAMESDFALGALASLIHAGGLGTAKQHIDEGVAHARARGSRFGLARLCAYRALLCWRLGQLATAASEAHFALSVAAAWGIPHAIAAAVLAQVHIERGDFDSAHRHLDSLGQDEAILEVTPNQIVRESHAALLLSEGCAREALVQLYACARWQQQAGIHRRLGPVAWRSAAALAHLRLDETDEARRLATCELQLAREYGAAPQLGAALRARGIVEGGAAGVLFLEESVAVLEKSGARLEYARAVVEHGALLRRCGQRRAASDALRAGMELANRCGTRSLVQMADAQLRLCGARPKRIATRGRDSLTPGEHRVSDLAAQGMSNKQIAQALFVTLRTVEMHLSNAYRKLEITSREQLPAALA
ncbi:MAG TPA: LuxR C-terminal-related transcriptional regulator, partial [Solirubrobacteraceae bacterium]|nr:LuxR C-terminal-related transcriptional regulator [Solirubrobacteraceae bacterium]